MQEAAGVDIILSAHGTRYQSYPELLSRVADALAVVQAGGTEFTAGRDCFGNGALEAAFNDFSIVVPPGHAQAG